MAKQNPAFRGPYTYNDAAAPDGETTKQSPSFRGIYAYSEDHAPDGNPSTPPIPPGPVVAAPTNDTQPTITSAGTVVGVTVSLDDAGVWEGEDVTLSYQWLVNGNPVGGETNPSAFMTSGLEAGDVVTLEETATNAGGSASVVSSNSVTLTSE